jgi:hypothetical protein
MTKFQVERWLHEGSSIQVVAQWLHENGEIEGEELEIRDQAVEGKVFDILQDAAQRITYLLEQWVKA